MVTQMFTPGIPQTQPGRAIDTASSQITLARMEIGGTRFLLPLADIVAVIEPTAMEAHRGDPDGVWIGHVRSQQGVIAVASGVALLQTLEQPIEPGRIAILRGELPVGLAVDRMLSAETVNRDALLPLPSAVPAIKSSPVSAVNWDEDDELELLLDRDALLADLDADFMGDAGQRCNSRRAQQKLLERYGNIGYRRSLEVRFDRSPERWIIPMSIVRLVTDSRDPHPLPRASRKVAGLVSWQRNPIPVVDPASEIELPEADSMPARFVVIGEPVDTGEASIQADAAILVDRVIGVHHNLSVEHGYAWDGSGDALNLLRIPDLLG